MTDDPAEAWIDDRVVKGLVAVLALSLGPITRLAAGRELPSISDAYWASDLARNVFVGDLWAIAALLFAYRGRSGLESALSNLAAVTAAITALVPCECPGHPTPAGCAGTPPTIGWIHAGAAGVTFLVLAYFCREFRRRALAKGHPEALRRAAIYTSCGLLIVGAVGAVAGDQLLGNAVRGWFPSLVWWCEVIALGSFGASWLTASRCLPWLTEPGERLPLFGSSGGHP